MGDVVSIEKDGDLATVIIDRPPLNLVTLDDIYLLGYAMGSLRQDPEVRAVVLTGRGRAFIGGADVSTFRAQDPVSAKFTLQAGQRVLRDIEEMEKPVLAAVNGFAFGGGCEVALACDIRICSQEARFGQLEINYGIIPGLAATQRLVRIVGLGRAKELVLTGRVLEAEEALRIGLVSEVVPPGELMDRARETAALLAEKAPIAMALAKELLNAAVECSIPVGGAFEAAACGMTMGTEDCAEGVSAFIEKRKPEFRGK